MRTSHHMSSCSSSTVSPTRSPTSQCSPPGGAGGSGRSCAHGCHSGESSGKLVSLTSALPERALHFAEAILAGEPAHRGAIELAIAAHRALLDRSQRNNFWETGWLDYQIAQLTARLEEAH